MAVSEYSAIADLSYRNYDGPMGSVNQRWRVIAKTMILKALRYKSFWVLTLFAGWYYIVMIVILFFLQQITQSNPGGLDTFISRIKWKDQFFHGFGYSQHLLLVVALLIGAGSIANDNRANALLVYLSKPGSKIDYLIGKWLGIFVPIMIVIGVPTFIFYLYGALSFKEQGFLSSDPWLFAKELALLPMAAAIQTSLVLMVSSLFRQGTIAGAVYAGVYFMGYFFSLIMKFVWLFGHGLPNWVVYLNYLSIDGFEIGLSRAIINPGTSLPFGMPSTRELNAFPTPPLVPYLVVVTALISICTYVTWTRIRAVEVV